MCNSAAGFADYKDNDVANQAFDSEGWFHTGHYGSMKDSCNVTIVDRLKELLRVGDGYSSHVRHGLEAVVCEHPYVTSDVVVGGYNGQTLIDRRTAFVVLDPDFQAKGGKEPGWEVENFAARKLIGLKSLAGGVRVLSNYLTAGFKIDGRTLKEMISVEPQVQPMSSRFLLQV